MIVGYGSNTFGRCAIVSSQVACEKKRRIRSKDTVILGVARRCFVAFILLYYVLASAVTWAFSQSGNMDWRKGEALGVH